MTKQAYDDYDAAADAMEACRETYGRQKIDISDFWDFLDRCRRDGIAWLKENARKHMERCNEYERKKKEVEDQKQSQRDDMRAGRTVRPWKS